MPESSTSIEKKVNNQADDLSFFSPWAIGAIFNAATVIKEEKKIIQVRGIFKKSGTANYGGNFYNRLKDEANDYSITLITSALMHNQLDDNKTIEFNGFITRKPDKQGRIELFINLIELLDQRVNKYSEEDSKKILLINKKVEAGFKDLDAHIKNSLFNNKKINIKVIMGKSGIIDRDINDALGVEIALYNIEYHRISLSSPEQIINKIISLDVPETDIICVARGGGENLDIFENLDICDSILGRNTIIASAIGHAQDVSLFEKLADKKYITPTQFGNYLNSIYNTTIEELEKSKAKLVQDITNQLTTNFSKQIANLNEQIKASKELHEKTKTDAAKNHFEQLKTLTDKLKAFEELAAQTTKDKATLHLTEVANLKKQIETITALHQTHLSEQIKLQAEKLKASTDQIITLQEQQTQKDRLIQQSRDIAATYQAQLKDSQGKFGSSIMVVILAAIIGLIIGYFIAAN